MTLDLYNSASKILHSSLLRVIWSGEEISSETKPGGRLDFECRAENPLSQTYGSRDDFGAAIDESLRNRKQN
ncbi:MAG: hypothetical protein MUC48_01145 [Leptolyngbya sp. Prado105]|nr:hypothetical protein [Leptolyngbya sp. Prado105]